MEDKTLSAQGRLTQPLQRQDLLTLLEHLPLQPCQVVIPYYGLLDYRPIS